MENEYINRELFRNNIRDILNDETCPLHIAVTINQYIDEEPSVDVAPVTHGAPIRKSRPRKYECFEEAKTENGEILYRKHVYVDETNWVEYCPVCKKRLCSRFENYCPNCGAKMF